jgi:hypothetical protein
MSIEEHFEEQFETFVPYNQNSDYYFVIFKEYLRDPETNQLDIIVVTYGNVEFELHWDDYDCYYRGSIVDYNNGKTIHGYVV